MRSRSRWWLLPLLGVLLGAGPRKVPAREVPAPPKAAPVSVLVVVRDLAAGERISKADVAELPIAAEWVTGALVKPNEGQYVFGQRLRLPALKGDLLTWTLIGLEPDPTIQARCVELTRPPATAAEQIARSRQAVLAPR